MTVHQTRNQDSRESGSRAFMAAPSLDRWAPPEALSTPPPIGGFKYRWIAEYVRGEYQSSNLSRAHQEGYIPVRRDELPEGFFSAPTEDGMVRTGGLILMKIPEKFTQQRKAYYAERSRESLKGANALQGIETPGSNMPVFEEDKSRTLVGAEAINELKGS